MSLTSEHKELYRAIDEILWKDWDPINVKDLAPRDEYQGYIPEILRMKISGADIDSISKRLYQIETEILGLKGNLEHCKLIAMMIFNSK
jgi:hypothetical protein